MTLLASILLAGKRYNGPAVFSMALLTLGGVLFVSGEAGEFRWLGVAFSLGAAWLRAIKTVWQGELLRGHGGRDPIHPIRLLFYVAPVNVVIFLCTSAVSEGTEPWTGFWELPNLAKHKIILLALLAALFNVLLATKWGKLSNI
jgi:drug/metabolite transporter (DMT)-like permease